MSSGCGDVLSLEDLKTAKKHQLFEAEVITGKAGGVAGGADIDYATNQVTGQTQKTLPAVLRDAGFFPASFDFTTGGTLTVNDRNKVVYDPVSMAWYSWSGALPKVIPAGSDPTADANWTPQTDPNLRNDLATSGAVIISGGNVTVEAVSPFNKNLPLNVFASKVATIDMFTGVVADGVTDTRQEVQDAIVACAAAKVKLRFTPGVYAFGNWLGIPSNADIVCDAGAVFKLLNYTTIDTGGPTPVGFGGFVIMGYMWDTQSTVINADNVRIDGMTIDVNGLDGENAFGGVRSSNCRITNMTLRGTVHSNARLGGKAIQFEGGLNTDIVVDNLTIEDCSIGISSQGLSGSTTNNQRSISYTNVRMRNVGAVVMTFGQTASPELATSGEQSVTIDGLTLHNCGSAQSWTGSPSAAGIFCSDRGANIAIRNVRLFNDPTYGAVGAIFRGPMFNVMLSDAYFEAPYIVAVVDQSAVGFGSPSGGAFQSYVITNDVKIKGTNLDYIAKSTSTTVGTYDLELDVDITSATIANIFDNNIAATAAQAVNAMLLLTDSGTGASTGRRSFRDIFLQGNTTAACIKHKDTSGTWTPVDSSGASLAFTVNGIQRIVRDGECIHVCMNVLFPTTTNTNPVAIGGLPVMGLSGVNYAGIGSVINGANGIAVVKGGEAFIRIQNATGGNITNADLSGRNVAVVLQYVI